MTPDPNIIGKALVEAGLERLPPAARVYLSGRLTRQFVDMGDAGDYEHNLGLLSNVTFGKAKTKAQLKKELAEEKEKLKKEKAKLAAEKAKDASQAQKAAQQRAMDQQKAQMQIMQAQQESAMAQQQAQMQQQFAQQQIDQANQQAQQAQMQAQQAAMQQQPAQQPMAQQTVMQPMQPAMPMQPMTQDPAMQQQESGQEIEYEGADGNDPVDDSQFAIFPDIGAAARALVATSYRAAPRDWGRVSAAEIAGLDVYPITRIRPLGAAIPVPEGRIAIPVRSGGAWHVPESEAERWGAERIEGEWIAPTVDLGWWPGMGPSSEAEATFRGLMSDWEAFDRLGVGQSILPHLRPDVVAWRKFRDEWKAGNIPSADIGGQLMAMTIMANRIRRELASAKIVDPALKGDRQGIAVDEAARLVKAAVPVQQFADSVPGLAWLTDSSLSPKAVTKRILTTVGVAFAVGVGGALLIARAAR